MFKNNFFKRLLSVGLCALILLAAIPLFPVTVSAATLEAVPEKDWTGYTPISSVTELDNIRNDLGGNYYLTCDIDMNDANDVLSGYFSNGWSPIGEGYAAVPYKIKSEEQFYEAYYEYGELFAFDADSQSYVSVYEYDPSCTDYRYHNMFTGIFDGNGYTVKNLKIEDGFMANGLFGVNSGLIKNVTVKSCNIVGYLESGSVCGINYGIITECYTEGSVYGYAFVGGLCGANYGIISECEIGSCVANATIYSGSIVGSNFGGYIQNCVSCGKVKGTYVSGGIAGVVWDSTIVECVFTGSVTNSNGSVGYMAGLELDDETFTTGNMYRKCVFRGSIAEYVWQEGDTYKYRTNIARLLGADEPTKDTYEAKGVDFENLFYWGADGKVHSVGSANKSAFKCSAVWDGTVAEGFARGKGTKLNPYVITTAAELAYFSKEVNAGNSFEGEYIKLGADIVINDTSVAHWFKNAAEFTPIGNIEAPFAGSFNGKGYKITGVYCDDPTYEVSGLFGHVLGGSISNLNAEVYIDSLVFGGGICGFLDEGVISNCHVSGFADGVYYAGLICGMNSGEITLCSVNGKVYSTDSAGGICGCNLGDVTRSWSDAMILGSDFYFGGICGENFGNVSYCYNAGAVDGERCIGGICGWNSDGLITECYSVGEIQAFAYAASICGRNDVTDSTKGIRNCLYLKESAHTNIQAASWTVQYGEGAESYYGSVPDKSGETKGCTKNYLKVKKNYKSFDLENIWIFDRETEYPYPELRMPEPEIDLKGDVNGDGVVNSIDSNMLKRNLTDISVEIAFDESDINVDGTVNSMDSNLLKRIIAGQN